MTKYIHTPLNEEIRSIGGYYKVLEEDIVDFEGRKLLYVLKAAHVDTSCCGAGGMGFISVPGFVVSYKTETSDSGYLVSDVKRVRDTAAQKRIKQMLLGKFSYISVVDFD